MKLSKKHLQAVQDLIDRYRSITLEEIKEAFKKFNPPLDIITKQELTGFGYKNSCTLCKSVTDCKGSVNCLACIHSNGGYSIYMCFKEESRSHKTFMAIDTAKTPTTLRNAYRKRADYLEHLLNDYKRQNHV